MKINEIVIHRERRGAVFLGDYEGDINDVIEVIVHPLDVVEPGTATFAEHIARLDRHPQYHLVTERKEGDSIIVRREEIDKTEFERLRYKSKGTLVYLSRKRGLYQTYTENIVVIGKQVGYSFVERSAFLGANMTSEHNDYAVFPVDQVTEHDWKDLAIEDIFRVSEFNTFVSESKEAPIVGRSAIGGVEGLIINGEYKFPTDGEQCNKLASILAKSLQIVPKEDVDKHGKAKFKYYLHFLLLALDRHFYISNKDTIFIENAREEAQPEEMLSDKIMVIDMSNNRIIVSDLNKSDDEQHYIVRDTNRNDLITRQCRKCFLEKLRELYGLSRAKDYVNPPTMAEFKNLINKYNADMLTLNESSVGLLTQLAIKFATVDTNNNMWYSILDSLIKGIREGKYVEHLVLSDGKIVDKNKEEQVEEDIKSTDNQEEEKVMSNNEHVCIGCGVAGVREGAGVKTIELSSHDFSDAEEFFDMLAEAFNENRSEVQAEIDRLDEKLPMSMSELVDLDLLHLDEDCSMSTVSGLKAALSYTDASQSYALDVAEEADVVIIHGMTPNGYATSSYIIKHPHSALVGTTLTELEADSQLRLVQIDEENQAPYLYKVVILRLIEDFKLLDISAINFQSFNNTPEDSARVANQRYVAQDRVDYELGPKGGTGSIGPDEELAPEENVNQVKDGEGYETMTSPDHTEDIPRY